MKLTLWLTLAGLLAGPAWAGAAPAAGPAAPAVGPASPSAGLAAPAAGPAAPAAVPKAVGQLPVSPSQTVEPVATAMNTLETGYNLFNLLAAPGMYDAVTTFTGQAAEAQAPQAQPSAGKTPVAAQTQTTAVGNSTKAQPIQPSPGREAKSGKSAPPSGAGSPASASPSGTK